MRKRKTFYLPFCFGLGIHNQNHPNRIRRESGTDCWVLELNIKGGAMVNSPTGREMLFHEGDLFYYRPTIPQSYQISPEVDSWEHYWVCFHPSDKMMELLDWKEVFRGFYTLSISNPDLMVRLINLFKEGMQLGASHYPQKIKLMDNILEQILLWLDTENPKCAYRGIDGRVRKCLRYIDESLGQCIRMEKLAEVAGLSFSRFAHLFRKSMGLSPLRYVEMRKMEFAAECLRTTSDPISEIAYKLGYADPLYFSRAFRRMKKVSPRMYRQKGG